MTYLTVVIERLCIDHLRGEWGGWRPSALARRLGPAAVLLETLVYHERLALDAAIATLRLTHGARETERQLHALFRRLPCRPARTRSDRPTLDDNRYFRDSWYDRQQDEQPALRVNVALSEAMALIDAETARSCGSDSLQRSRSPRLRGLGARDERHIPEALRRRGIPAR